MQWIAKGFSGKGCCISAHQAIALNSILSLEKREVTWGVKSRDTTDSPKAFATVMNKSSKNGRTSSQFSNLGFSTRYIGNVTGKIFWPIRAQFQGRSVMWSFRVLPISLATVVDKSSIKTEEHSHDCFEHLRHQSNKRTLEHIQNWKMRWQK